MTHKDVNDRPPIAMYDFRNKQKCFDYYIQRCLNKSNKMFVYGGLPDTMPAWVLEREIQFNGFMVVSEYENSLIALYGGLGGKRDIYYNPTILTVANPALPPSFPAELKLSQDCILIKNDTMLQGLLPLYSRFATLFVENDITMYLQDIQSRAMLTIAGDTDRSQKSAEIYIQKLIAGELKIIAGDEFLEGVKLLESTTNNKRITDTIEYRQFLEAKLNNAIGLASNYNMKREHLTAAETDLTDDVIPDIEDMLQCRKDAVGKINEKYGTSITVELNEPWRSNRLENEVNENAETKGNFSDNVKRYISDITTDKS